MASPSPMTNEIIGGPIYSFSTSKTTSSSSNSSSDSDNVKGFILAVVSGFFIGVSFIIKKFGLQRAAVSGSRAMVFILVPMIEELKNRCSSFTKFALYLEGLGGYGYLLEPLWWVGMITMIVGEFANFVAYIFAPAVLVTPLGALSIIVSAILAHFFLKEKMRKLGVVGCLLCIVGSTLIVLHAPSERSVSSVEEIWDLATQPDFLLYVASVVAVVLSMILYFGPRYGQTNILIYVGICSIIGSLTVMSIKAIGIAIELTLEGSNQASHFQTWVFAIVAITCIITQLNYLNKALDTFDTAVVSPIYYAMFTTFTIVASAIMFKVWYGESATNIVSVLCGFITVLSGTLVLHSSRDQDPPPVTEVYSPPSPKATWLLVNGEKERADDELSPDLIAILKQDHFR